MKTQVLGVKRMNGIAKESGNPFDMASIFVVVPIETSSNAKITIQGYGYEVGEMALEPEALKQFESFKFPCSLELTLEPVLYRGKISQIVTGTTSAAPPKAVNS